MSSVIESLLAGFTPERLLRDPAATGAGVAVAIIDSGIEQSLLQSRHGATLQPIIGVRVKQGRPPEFEPDDGHHSTPHGTAVADVVLQVAPQVRLYSVDVFGAQGSAELDNVIAGLRYAIDNWPIRVLNLSLGVVEQKLQQPAKKQQLYRLIEEAYYRDIMVVAAAHNEHPLQRSYPAAFAPLLFSVDKGVFDRPDEFSYKLREFTEFIAHGRGYLGPFTREPATSWATPHLSGLIAKLLSLEPILKAFEVKSILYWMFQSRQRSLTVP